MIQPNLLYVVRGIPIFQNNVYTQRLLCILCSCYSTLRAPQTDCSFRGAHLRPRGLISGHAYPRLQYAARWKEPDALPTPKSGESSGKVRLGKDLAALVRDSRAYNPPYSAESTLLYIICSPIQLSIQNLRIIREYSL
jgi:hypothetical protein